MRAAVWVLIPVLALAACSPKTPAGPTAPPTPVSPPPIPSPEAPPPPPTVGVEFPSPPAPVDPAAPSAPAKPATVRFSPRDYPAQERRIAALLNNAESRDTTNQTAQLAEFAHRHRESCTTRACIERSYAAEEAQLRSWESSGEIR